MKFEFEVYLIGRGDTGLVRRYSQPNLKFYTTLFYTKLFLFDVKDKICTIHAKLC